jgi:hypothetical protein
MYRGAVRPKPEPCENFRSAEVTKFARHVFESGCQECIAFVRSLEEQSRLAEFLQMGTPGPKKKSDDDKA